MTPTQRDINAATTWWLINHEGEPPANLFMAFARHAAGDPVKPLAEVEHPMANASLVEVMDYLALRLAEERADNDQDRKLDNAIDRFDEAYMWTIAWLSSLGIETVGPQPASDTAVSAPVEGLTSADAFRRGAEAMQRSLADALRDHLNSRAAAIANSLPIPEYQP